MPCPYFLPSRQFVWASAPILPLGDAYQGLCQIGETQLTAPAEALVDLCNLGYARGRCPRFPDEAGPDAVRFAVIREEAGIVAVAWARERNHEPFDHGMLEFASDRCLTPAGHLPEVMLRQAGAYVASYLRRTEKERK